MIARIPSPENVIYDQMPIFRRGILGNKKSAPLARLAFLGKKAMSVGCYYLLVIGTSYFYGNKRLFSFCCRTLYILCLSWFAR